MKYDFAENPRAWTFTGDVKKVKVPRWYGWTIGYQWVFEKDSQGRGDCDPSIEVVRIGVMIVDGRVSISDPPAGE